MRAHGGWASIYDKVTTSTALSAATVPSKGDYDPFVDGLWSKVYAHAGDGSSRAVTQSLSSI